MNEHSTDLLMNPATGSIDTRENWAAEGYTEENSDLELVFAEAENDL